MNYAKNVNVVIINIKTNMVKQTIKNNKIVYICEECKFLYKEKQWARKCEDWCKKHHSCNLEITKHSIKS